MDISADPLTVMTSAGGRTFENYKKGRFLHSISYRMNDGISYGQVITIDLLTKDDALLNYFSIILLSKKR